MFLLTILKQTVTVTVFVLVMMIVIEYITVQFKGLSKKKIPSNPFFQIIFGILAGLIPGCLGSYAVVSMYIHGTISFAALTATFVATSGDEAFIMFSVIPVTALKIMILTAIIAFVTGVATHFISKGKMYKGKSAGHKFIHSGEPQCLSHNFKMLPRQLYNIIWQRAFMILFGTGFLLFLFISSHGHGHEFNIIETASKNTGHDEQTWSKIIFLIVTLSGLFIAFTVTDHFLKKHLWEHIIKKHFLKLFGWSFATFFALHFLNQYIEIKDMIKGNMYLVLLIAAIIGMIPESGPHIIFISMFAAGYIPLPVLLANSIVQDGHGSIPLLAESGKDFLKVKIINLAAGLFFGYIMLFFT